MKKKLSLIQWLAWFYAINFLIIFIICHWPGLTDSHGLLLGLFSIDPVDDVIHLASGIVAAVVAIHSTDWSVKYFKLIGIPYGIDAFFGLFFSAQFLNGGVFTQPLGNMDFSANNILANVPHILIVATTVYFGYFLSKQKRFISVK